MSKLYKRFEIDLEAQEQGLWEDFGDGIRVRIRRWRSKASADIRRQLEAPYLEKIRARTLTDDEATEITLKHVARLITDWEGIENRAGETIEYSPEAAEIILRDLPEFRDEIVAVALDRENYKADRLKESEKN